MIFTRDQTYHLLLNGWASWLTNSLRNARVAGLARDILTFTAAADR